MYQSSLPSEKRAAGFVLLIVLFAALTQFHSTSKAQDIIKAAYDNWPPFTIRDSKSLGICNQIVIDSFAKEGLHNIQLELFPTARALQKVLSGKWDVSVCWSKNKNRSIDFEFSDPIFKDRFYFFHLKNNPFSWDLVKDLQRFDIGIVNGFSYGEKFDDLNSKGLLKTQSVSDSRINIRKLLKGRIQAFAESPVVIDYILRKEFSSIDAEKITFFPKPIKETTFHLIALKMNKNSQKLIRVFNRGLKKLQLASIYPGYFSQLPKSEYLYRDLIKRDVNLK